MPSAREQEKGKRDGGAAQGPGYVTGGKEGSIGGKEEAANTQPNTTERWVAGNGKKASKKVPDSRPLPIFEGGGQESRGGFEHGTNK